MYHAGPGEWPKKLQTPNQALWYCLAVHKLKILANVLLGMRELRNRPPKKSDFVYSRTKLLPTNSSSYWATLTQNDIAFVVVAPFSPFVCKLARVAVLASWGTQQKFCHFNQQKKNNRGSAQFTCKRIFITLCLWWLRSRCLPNPCQSESMSSGSRPPVRVFSKCYGQAEVLSLYMLIVDPLQSLKAWPTQLL